MPLKVLPINTQMHYLLLCLNVRNAHQIHQYIQNLLNLYALLALT